MKQLENTLKAVADVNRIRILKLLERKKMCVCELAFILGVTQPSISRHLKKLKKAGLIDSEQDGFWTNYFIAKARGNYAKTMLQNLKKWANNDVLIKKDSAKAEKIKRPMLCCRT